MRDSITIQDITPADQSAVNKLFEVSIRDAFEKDGYVNLVSRMKSLKIYVDQILFL